MHGSGLWEFRSCDEAHETEVVGIAFMPGGADAPYPGDSPAFDAGVTACGSAFLDYVGVDYYEQSTLVMTFDPPNATEWAVGYRRIVCLVTDYSGNKPLTRSVRRP